MKRKLIIAILTLSASLLAQNGDNLSLLARWASGPCKAVMATTNYLYIGNGSYLDIVNRVDPDNHYSRYEMPGLIEDIDYYNLKIYVAVKEMGVYMLNGLTINPFEDDHYMTEGSAHRLDYENGYLYLADGESGLYIFQIDDEYIEHSAYLQFTSPVHDVAVSGDIAYLAVDSLGLVTVDISDPAIPAILDTADTPGSSYSVYIQDGTAFVAVRNDGVWAIDVSDPQNLTVNNQWTPEPNTVTLSDIVVSAGAETAYLSDEGYGLRIIDLATMTEATPFNTGGDAFSLCMDHNYPDDLYLADGDFGLRKINVESGLPPAQVDSVLTGGQAMDVLYTSDATFVAGGQSGLWIVDHNNLDEEINPIFAHEQTQNAMGLALDGNMLMVADGPGGLICYNVDDLSSPEISITILRDNDVLDVAILGDSAYVAEGVSGIRIVDISNQLPIDRGLIEGINGFNAIGVTADERSNRVYVAADTNGLKVLDINTNTIVGTYDDERKIQSVGVPQPGASVIYAACGDNGLVGFNVSNTENITISNEMDTDGFAYDVDFNGNIAVVADGKGTIRLIDFSNAESLDQVGSYHTEGTSYAVDVNADTVAVADGEGGVYYLQSEFKGEIQVDMDSLNFGNIAMGKSRTLSMIVHNTGTFGLAATELTSNNGLFEALNLPQWISKGDTAYISVRFTPDSYGTMHDTLKLYTEAANSPHSLTVMGTCVEPTPLSAYSPDYYAYALYHMDTVVEEDTLLPDSSLYGWLDGTVKGATLTQEDGGRFNKGLIFDENDIVIMNLDSLGKLLPFYQWPGATIETWFKLDSIPEGTAVLFQFTDGGRVIFELSVQNDQLIGVTGANVQQMDTLWSNPETPLVRDQWYHAALSIGSEFKLYFNGHLEEQTEINSRVQVGITLAATIGNDAALERPFHGVMDEMRFSAISREPWELNVSTGRIHSEVNSISFGSVYVGKSTNYYLKVRNKGEGPLIVDSLFTLSDHFQVTGTGFELESNESHWVKIQFTPTEVRNYQDVLTIRSNDLFQPKMQIPLYGAGFQSVSLEAYEPDTLTSGLWHLDGTVDMDSIPDASDNGLVGYFWGNGISWDTIYKRYGSSSLRFSGDTSWVRIDYNPIFDYTSTPFTLETWFSLNGRPATDKQYVLFRHGSGTNLQYEVFYNDTLTSGKGLVVRVYAANNNIFSLYGPPDSEMDLEKWYHMAVTWDRNKLRLYLNGVIVDSKNFSGSLRKSASDLSMGGDYGNGSGFNGNLDEIRFSHTQRQPEAMNVGVPNLSIITERLDFGTIFIGSDSSRIFTLFNTGTLPLFIDSMKTNTDLFEVSPGQDTLNVDEIINVQVRFSPEAIGAVEDTLYIYSNDQDTSVYKIVLTGAGIDYRPKAPCELDQYTIALYHCDAADGNTVSDETGNNDGTFTGTRIDTAYFDGGLEFNGVNHYIWMNDAAALRFNMETKSFTIECFFKTDTLNQVIFFKDNYQGTGTNKANYGLSINTDGILSLHGFGAGTSYVADGVWHHVAFVYNAAGHLATLYLDGEIEMQETWETGDTDVNNPGSLFFGVRDKLPGQKTGFFQGQMDEIRISSIAREPWDLIFKGTGIFASIAGKLNKNVQKQVNITIPATDSETGREVWLHYRQGGQRLYQVVQATPVPDDITDTQYTAVIPASAMSERGLEFYIELNVSGESYKHPLYDPVNKPLTRQVRFNSLTPDTTLPSKKYTMVSVPGDLENANVGTVLRDNLGSWDPYEWRCLTWKDTLYWEYNDTLTTYEDSLVFSFDSGRAFWLISAEETKWNVDAGQSISTETPYRFHIRPQWNMIGAPYAFPVQWNDCAITSDSLETLYYYDGKGYQLDWKVFEPWGGYWIYNAARTYQDLYVPPREPAVLAKHAPVRGGVIEELTKKDWIWQFSAKTEEAEDMDNFFGVRQDAADTWDLRDRAEPPPIGNYISVYFDHSDWEKHPGTYAADIRNIKSEGYTWDLLVESRLEKTSIQLTWILHQSMPEGWEVRLADPVQGLTVNMLSQNGYTIVTGKEVPNVTTMKCIAGPPEYVDKQVKEAIAPVAFHLYQNYPNPFNPVTTIKYTLPSTGRVKLSIFNMLGQRVARLINEEQVTGEYELHWAGVSDSGTQVSSGVYFYRLEFPGRVAIRKMILIR